MLEIPFLTTAAAAVPPAADTKRPAGAVDAFRAVLAAFIGATDSGVSKTMQQVEDDPNPDTEGEVTEDASLSEDATTAQEAPLTAADLDALLDGLSTGAARPEAQSTVPEDALLPKAIIPKAMTLPVGVTPEAVMPSVANMPGEGAALTGRNAPAPVPQVAAPTIAPAPVASPATASQDPSGASGSVPQAKVGALQPRATLQIPTQTPLAPASTAPAGPAATRPVPADRPALPANASAQAVIRVAETPAAKTDKVTPPTDAAIPPRVSNLPIPPEVIAVAQARSAARMPAQAAETAGQLMPLRAFDRDLPALQARTADTSAPPFANPEAADKAAQSPMPPLSAPPSPPTASPAASPAQPDTALSVAGDIAPASVRAEAAWFDTPRTAPVPLPQLDEALRQQAMQLAQRLAQVGDATSVQSGRTADGQAHTEIELSPAELGRLKMVLHSTERGLHLAITAERPETLDLVRRNLEGLQRALLEDGVSLAGLDLGSTRQGGGDRSASADHVEADPQVASVPADMPPPVQPTRLPSSQRLDIRI